MKRIQTYTRITRINNSDYAWKRIEENWKEAYEAAQCFAFHLTDRAKHGWRWGEPNNYQYRRGGDDWYYLFKELGLHVDPIQVSPLYGRWPCKASEVIEDYGHSWPHVWRALKRHCLIIVLGYKNIKSSSEIEEEALKLDLRAEWLRHCQNTTMFLDGSIGVITPDGDIVYPSDRHDVCSPLMRGKVNEFKSLKYIG